MKNKLKETKMKTLIKSSLLLSVAVIISGCESKKFVSLPENIKCEINSSDVWLDDSKQKIHTKIEKSYIRLYTLGGVIPSLLDFAIEEGREERANDALLDVRNEFEAFNFKEKYKDKLEQLLKKTDWLHVNQINYTNRIHVNDTNYINTVAEENLRKVLSKTQSDAVLTCQLRFNLNPQMSVLTGTLYATLYPTSDKIKNIANAEDPLRTPIFKFHVATVESLPNPSNDVTENTKKWMQNDGEYINETLDNIIHQNFIRLEKALKDPSNLPEEDI